MTFNERCLGKNPTSFAVSFGKQPAIRREQTASIPGCSLLKNQT
jgi:hypothetical protein